ncbi:MAG: TatD family hydrolase [Bacteroidales bacterium]|nr:TatD family hydrolase [Bacteroidales bacterium]
MLIDTHSHIYSEEFDSDRDAVVQRAESVGVGMILLPAIDGDSYDRQESLASSRPDLFRQMMGLHPTSVNETYQSALAIAKEKLYANPDKYIGIGEVGLDFYWDTTFRSQQIDALERQVEWARELDKPIVLHLRNGKDGLAGSDAYAEVFDLLRRCPAPNRKGIMHCFSGSMGDAERAVAMGFMLGIGGVVTYKKSTLPTIVSTVPLENIVLETDSPYLAPVPYRGHRNESAYVSVVADKVAEIKGITPSEVAVVTANNAIRLFGLE